MVGEHRDGPNAIGDRARKGVGDDRAGRAEPPSPHLRRDAVDPRRGAAGVDEGRGHVLAVALRDERGQPLAEVRMVDQHLDRPGKFLALARLGPERKDAR